MVHQSQLPTRSSVYPAHFGLTPNARPIRDPRKFKSRGWHGTFASTKALGASPFESLLERDFQSLISVDSRIKKYAVQPHRLTYWAPDKEGRIMKRSYTPDIVALGADNHIHILEVKAKGLANRKEWRRVEPYIRAAYAKDHAATFLVFTEDQIRVEPRLSNAKIILAHARTAPDPAIEFALDELLDRPNSSKQIAEIEDVFEALSIHRTRAFSAVLRGVCAGKFAIDLSRAISGSSLVSKAGAQ